MKKVENLFKKKGFKSEMGYTKMESLCPTPETNVILYVHYTSKKKKSEMENFKMKRVSKWNNLFLPAIVCPLT